MMYYRQFNGMDDVNEVQRTRSAERSGRPWQSSPVNEFESEGYFMANLNPKRTVSQYSQDPGWPKWSTNSSKALAIEARSPRMKKEAELESAVRILQNKLEYTEKKIMESENNKELLKARLDKLIFQLTKAGFDPNLRPPAKQVSGQSPRRPPKMEELKVKAIEPLEPVIKAVIVPFGTNRPAKVSDESWEKLLALASEYEQRLNTIKSLEEQEKYVKQQLTPPTQHPDVR